MPHGGPDWGTLGPLGTVYTIEDMAELAARLGSIDTFDRRGNVIFMEDFQGSLAKVYHDTLGVGASVSISNERARFGNFSCKLVTGNLENDWAEVGAIMAYPALSQMGFEISWDVPTLTDLNTIDFYLYLYDGATAWYASVYWDRATKTWYYHDETAWRPLSPTAACYADDVHFNFLKLVVDFVNKKYVRLTHNSRTYDLTDKALDFLAAPAESPRMLVSVKSWTAVDDNCKAYVGHMIVTQNE